MSEQAWPVVEALHACPGSAQVDMSHFALVTHWVGLHQGNVPSRRVVKRVIPCLLIVSLVIGLIDGWKVVTGWRMMLDWLVLDDRIVVDLLVQEAGLVGLLSKLVRKSGENSAMVVTVKASGGPSILAYVPDR